MTRSRVDRLQPRLLLSHLVVVAVGVGTAAVAAQLLAPTLFDRLLEHHAGTGGMMHGMSPQMHADTVTLAEDALFQALLLAVVAGTAAAVVASLFVARRITTPIVAMSRTSRQIASGDYAARVDAGVPGELGALAADLNAMAAELQATEQRRAALITDVAHELRTPLATVSGYLEGLADGVVPPSPDLWTQLHAETDRLQRLVDDLQELARLEAGGASLRLAAVPLEQVVDAALARLAPAYAAKGVSAQTTGTGNVPPVWADADRVVQVLTNLLSNALRASEPGGVVAVTLALEGDVARCSVQDSGRGIAPEHLTRVFDRFYRTDQSRSRDQGGSGIGLTVARAIVEAHGGRISAASPGLGMGATFSFTLPLVSTS